MLHQSAPPGHAWLSTTLARRSSTVRGGLAALSIQPSSVKITDGASLRVVTVSSVEFQRTMIDTRERIHKYSLRAG